MKEIINIGDPRRLVAARLREMRFEAEMTQQQVADGCGLSRKTIATLESGRANVSIRHVFEYAKGVDIDPREIVCVLDEWWRSATGWTPVELDRWWTRDGKLKTCRDDEETHSGDSDTPGSDTSALPAEGSSSP